MPTRTRGPAAARARPTRLRAQSSAEMARAARDALGDEASEAAANAVHVGGAWNRIAPGPAETARAAEAIGSRWARKSLPRAHQQPDQTLRPTPERRRKQRDGIESTNLMNPTRV